MAVYTNVSDQALADFIAEYDVGQVTSFKGIAEGVENSNFLLRTTRNQYILTLYERRVNEADLPFFLGLMRHLAAKGVNCPLPVEGRDGAALRRLNDRPAAVITFLDGVSISDPSPEHCHCVGEALGGFHAAGADFPMTRPNSLSLGGWDQLANAIGARADTVQPGLAAEIRRTLEHLLENWPRDLPHGVIHADLFPDNVFFLNGRVSGLIDFYFSCSDFLSYDLAVLINAWCFDSQHQFDGNRLRAMIDGYAKVRTLNGQERTALPILAQGAAMRFMLTRLYDWLNQVPGALVKPKDPIEYLTKMRFFGSGAGRNFMEHAL